jgi:hypothetical protein
VSHLNVALLSTINKLVQHIARLNYQWLHDVRRLFILQLLVEERVLQMLAVQTKRVPIVVISRVETAYR